MKEIIQGSDITGIRTLKSMYDMDSVQVTIGNEVYRLHSRELLQMVTHFKFLPIKKIKHTYLEII